MWRNDGSLSVGGIRGPIRWHTGPWILNCGFHSCNVTSLQPKEVSCKAQLYLRILSFEMKCYRKILRISWTERKTNASVLEQLGVKAPQLLNLIKKQKLSYFGHIKRHNTLEKLFLEGTCEGRRGRGRPRRRWTQDIGEWMGVSTVEAGRQSTWERGVPSGSLGGHVH